MLNRRRLCSWLTGLLLLGWLSPLRAEEPVLVDFDAKVIKAATVKDDRGKKLRLSRNEKVTVRYMRGNWCWLQTKKKKSAWVACATLKPSQPPVASTPASAVAAAEPATATTAAASQPAAATATVSHQASIASSAPADATGASAVLAKLAAVEAAAGTIALTVSERDATIAIDSNIVGSSPLPSIAVPSGRHTLRVEKSGFVRWTRAVDVIANQTSSVDVNLVPSAKYRDAYLGRNLALRIGAFSALGLGGLALAGAGGLFAWRTVQANQLHDRIVAYNAQDPRSEADRQQLLAERGTIAIYDVATVATAGGGLLFALTGAILFLVGDDPGRYDN